MKSNVVFVFPVQQLKISKAFVFILDLNDVQIIVSLKIDLEKLTLAVRENRKISRSVKKTFFYSFTTF